jgi:hypothetical protein
MGEAPANPPVRLSDDERALAARRLDEAVATGRITWLEHTERSTRVWEARVHGDLAPLLADLGTVDAVPARSAPARRVSAVASKIVRTAESCREIEASAVFGAVVLDLSAMGPGEQILIKASSVCGKVMIRVADDATVLDEGTAVLGKRTILGAPDAPGGPIVRITGRSVCGHLKVYRGDRWW